VPIAAAVAVPIGIAAADQPQNQQGQLLIAGATPVKVIKGYHTNTLKDHI
jgi:hypothetical protein